MEKPVALVLGGTSPHVLLVNKLKERGFFVILADYLENPPAAKVADEHVKASTLDSEQILSIARERKVSLVISTCIDQANSVCCYVSEKLGLPHPYSYETSLNVTDKGLMKRIMVEGGIPTSAFQTVSSVEEINWKSLEYPAVVKPVDCNSSKGVRLVDSDEETVIRVEEALSLSRSGKAIIERYNQGPEIQVDCVAASNGVKVMMTRQKQKIAVQGDEMVLQSFGSVFPAPVSEDILLQAQDIAERIASSFGLENTPFFYQAIVTDSGIKVLEFAPRIGGGLSYHVLRDFCGYDAVECAVDSFLGKPFSIEPQVLDSYYSTNILYMKPGVFDHVEGFEELKASGVIRESFVMKASGSEIDSDMRSSNRVAAFIVEGDDYAELTFKASRAMATLRVVDVSGNDLLNRDIYPVV